MGAAMVSLVENADDGRTPAATAWVLSAGAAVVLCAAMLISASLQAWHDDRGLYRLLAYTCVAVAVACLALGATRPAPLVLALALVLLLSIPWVLAVAHRLSDVADPAHRVTHSPPTTPHNESSHAKTLFGNE
jgi:MFS-type transporter involved in bile tolerance (Atg22 family)